MGHQVVAPADQGTQGADIVGGGHQRPEAVAVGAQHVGQALGIVAHLQPNDGLAGAVDDADGVAVPPQSSPP